MRGGSAIPGVSRDIYGDRRPIEGVVVALLHVTFDERGLNLIGSRSRALRRGEIHELMITDEEAKPGSRVDRVSVIAFFEVETGGLAVHGDDVMVGDQRIGHIAGFDLTHMPNHMNILVKAPSLQPPPIRLGDRIKIGVLSEA
ncbi:MAG: hypothetical protein AYL28_002630 [Candidatus Bathyarchaeota archaeon B23]|nr:MAG: hypothetical protein AYL28_002630 [Candidatus Bathyarchaeota archaeon B23]